MSDNTPIWLLDVDGVLNAVSRVLPDNFSTGLASPDDGRSYTIQWNPTIIERIKQLHDSENVEVQWLTTWGSGANGDLCELLGFDKFEVAAEPPDYAWGGWSAYSSGPRPPWWKLRVAADLIAKNPSRRIVWTDDEIGLEPDAMELVKANNVFAVSPPPNEGLSLLDLSRIEQFVKGRQAPGIRIHGKTLW